MWKLLIESATKETTLAKHLFQKQTIDAIVTSVYDGDTLNARFFLTDTLVLNEKVRLYGIDTPELKSRNLLEKEAAQKARDFLENLLALHHHCVRLHFTKANAVFDKYGRLLAKITLGETSEDVSEQMLLKGYAKSYDGMKSKSEWTREELENIINLS
jgi:micrococcal nuclease